MSRRISLTVLHRRFESILPTVRSVAQFVFRDRPPRHREEYVQEAICYAWASFVRLAKRGKDARRFASRFARYNAQAVRNGRRVAGGYNKHDLTTVPAETSGSHIEPLHVAGRGSLIDVLKDARGYSPADAAATRIDFAAWRMTLSRRNRRILDLLAAGERTSDVARQFRLTPGRISQLRREFRESWLRFTGDRPDPGRETLPAAA